MRTCLSVLLNLLILVVCCSRPEQFFLLSLLDLLYLQCNLLA